jgi:hypothetical protein
MPTGTLGVDSLNPVTASAITVAKTLLGGRAPAHWGRYITFQGDTNPGEYQSATEKVLFANNGIRLIPYARQTNNVGSNNARGTADGTRNAEAFVGSLGADLLKAQGGKFYIFLDVEPDVPMSQDYYAGWSTALVSRGMALTNNAVDLQPCVYLNPSDPTTITALNNAVAAGARCEGVTVARYFGAHATGFPGPFDWNNDFIKPKVPLTPTVIAWQYIGNFENLLDAAQSNPNNDQAAFLARLALPG